jgi:RNA recognition motif-containing protein
MSSNCVSFNQDASVSTKHVIEYLKKMVPNKKDLIKIMLILLQEPEPEPELKSEIKSSAHIYPPVQTEPCALSKFDNFIQKPLCIKLDNDILRQENIIEVNPFSSQNKEINTHMYAHAHFSEEKIIPQDILFEPIEPIEPIDSRQLFVRNLAFCTTKETLYYVFSSYGEVIDTRVQYEQNYGSAFMKSKGFGFVTFKNTQSAQLALLDKNIVIDNRPVDCHLSVNGKYSRPPNKHNKHYNNI